MNWKRRPVKISMAMEKRGELRKCVPEMIAGSLENIYILTLKKRPWLFWLDFRANLTRLVGRDHREHVWFSMQWRVDKKGHSPQATRWATGYWAKTRTSKTEGLVAIKLLKTIAAILRILRNHSCNCSLPAQMSPSGWVRTLAYGLMWRDFKPNT